MIRIATMSLLVLASAALADDGDLRAKLVGSWQAETTAGKEASHWSLQRSADAIHISASNGAKTLAEFDCKMAQECEIKDSGHRAKVTIYFNGPKIGGDRDHRLACGEAPLCGNRRRRQDGVGSDSH